MATAGRGAPSPAPDRGVTVSVDGACSGNPGPGGWGVIVVDGDETRELSGSEPVTTNQRMELRAAIEGLRAVPGRRRVALHSDSAYVVNCFRERWYARWRQNGWRNAQKKPVENRDLWEALLAEADRHDVTWHKVAGHSGDPLNERADQLAVGAIARAGQGGRALGRS
jgi:ribonuclease HI